MGAAVGVEVEERLDGAAAGVLRVGEGAGDLDPGGADELAAATVAGDRIVEAEDQPAGAGTEAELGAGERLARARVRARLESRRAS